MIFISITRDAKNLPEFQIEVNDRPVAAFPPTAEGLRNLGRMIASQWPDSDCFFSSDLDFPSVCGVSLTANEVHASIEAGIADGPHESELCWG
jgi:hypothetical protein